MTALPPVPQVIRLTLKYTYGTDPVVVNRFFLGYSGTAPTNATLQTWLNTVGVAYTAHLAAESPTELTLIELDAVDLTTASSAAASATQATVGTKTGALLPAGTCVLLNYKVQRRYRGGKPRQYLPWGTSTDLTNAQTWTGAAVSAFLTAWNAWISQITATPPAGTTITGQVNVSYYHQSTVVLSASGRAKNVSTVRPSPVVDPITSVTVDPRVASQRRRNRP